jgi:hypothetical protein
MSVLLIWKGKPLSFFCVTNACLPFVSTILKQPFCSVESPTYQ